MSRGSADAAVGMMDAAYFTGRKELLDFFNETLQLNLGKIEETATGAVACQLTDYIFPGSIPMSRVNWGARSDYEFVQNYKLLQSAFTKHHVQRHVDVDKLIRAKYQDNLEFCQWLKAFFDQSAASRDDYDPVMVRARGKGGKQYNDKMGNGASGSRVGSSNGASARARPTTTTRRPMAAATRKPVVTKPQPVVVDRALQERTAAENAEAKAEKEAAEAALVALAEMEIKNKELIDKVDDLETSVLEVETERDSYFQKLRYVEILLQVHQEKQGDSEILVDDVFKILYATPEDNLIVNEEGEVVCSDDIVDSLVDTV